MEVRKVSPESIILYGRSLGSGPSCYLAAKTAAAGRSVGGVILHSPFLSVYRIALDPGFTMPGDMFQNIENAPKIRCPVMIIHGTADIIVPFWHGQELLMHVPQEYRAPPFWAEEMGHNCIELYARDEYLSNVKTFIEKYIASSSGDLIPPQPIPEHERAEVEPVEGGPCSVRLNLKWLGGSGASVIRAAVKNRKETKAVRRRVKDDDLRDEVATLYNEDDNRTLFTERSRRSHTEEKYN